MKHYTTNVTFGDMLSTAKIKNQKGDYNMTYKTFENLTFVPSHIGEGQEAVMLFENGYGVYVTRYKLANGQYGSITNNEEEWEFHVIKTTQEELNDNKSIENFSIDKVAPMNEAQISEAMIEVQKFVD